MPDARFVQRLCAFVAASIALHAVLLVAYVPHGKGGTAEHNAAAKILNAVLAPGPISSPSEAETQRPSDLPVEEPSTSAVQARSLEKGRDLPVPDKWYTATELEVLAEPLAPAKLVYPEEHIAQAVVTRVRVRLFVDEAGVVRKLEVVESGAEPAFEAAAKKAWESMRFSPALRDGVAVKSQKLLELEFLPF